MSRKTETIVVQSPALGTKEHWCLILAGDYPDGKLATEAHHSREGVVCGRGRPDLLGWYAPKVDGDLPSPTQPRLIAGAQHDL